MSMNKPARVWVSNEKPKAGDILRVRALAQAVAKAYYEQREKLGFPGAKKA